VFRQRAFMTVTLAGCLLVGVAHPAGADADLLQKKAVSGPHGRSGKVFRYADRTADDVSNYLRITADDADGKGGRCTETWIDYATKPHQHFNPGLLVNCSGRNRSIGRAFLTGYEGISGVQIVVCEVPNSSGRIVRNGKNCRGNLSGIYLRSGRRYRDFGVDAIQRPNGVRIWRR
jgi:hypothetical protein